MLILAPCLSSSLKYDGIFTLQVSGQDPIKTLLVDVTSEGTLRAYLAFDSEKLNEHTTTDPLQKLTGGGYIAFTVDQGKNEERYQGIVELNKNNLTDCVHDYFRTSEQIETIVNLAVEKSPSGKWCGRGYNHTKRSIPWRSKITYWRQPRRLRRRPGAILQLCLPAVQNKNCYLQPIGLMNFCINYFMKSACVFIQKNISKINVDAR